MPLFVHRSNRTERLVDALATVVAKPRAREHVLEPEWIVVSSPGMERWLSMQLSRRLGVWANPKFPFPRNLIQTLLDAADPDGREQGAGYEPTCMLFGIAAELRTRADDPLFAEVERYLRDDANARRRLALAARLSELFDQYLTYRPDELQSWAADGGASALGKDFQPALFRALIARHGAGHLAARAQRASRRLPHASLSEFPQRIHLFGLSSMPPLYLELLSALASAHEAHLYLLSPTREYFADLRPKPRRRERRQLSFDFDALDALGEDVAQEGHPLLTSLGRHARELQELLETRTSYRETAQDLYEDPGERCLLHVLQSDLLALRTRDQCGGTRHRLRPDDDSVSIHACHSPMRELEVLHDQLSRLISERGVQPHEIIVMTPVISEYAKVIDAVFSQPESQRPLIPFRIADRGASETQALMLALDALLDVLQGRFGANQVLDLLGFDLIRAGFEIAVDQVDALRSLIEDSGIRWGVDAEHRQAQDQPACDDNTWRFGLARLALGYSTGLAPEQLFAGCSPLSLESGQGQLLGQFLAFCETLFELRQLLQAPASAQDWPSRINQVVRVVFGDRADPGERKQLSLSLRELAEHAERAGFDEPFELTSLRALLERGLSTRQPTHGFMASGVTFCQMLPMRSIPFKVLCMIGLNDGVFPQSDTPFSFDIMHAKRRPGDRCRRDDDRQLFLEALLSAREQLLITFVGQSLKSGKPLPPSVLVNELIDCASRSCELPDAARDKALTPLARAAHMESRLLLRHPLSGTSPRYFGADADARLFSYARGSCKAARAVVARAATPARFSVLTGTPPERPTEIGLQDLERALMRPAREFCQRRLGLYLGDDLSALPEREPMELNALERWKIATEWLEHMLAGKPEASRLEVQRARGRLPHFVSGDLFYDDLQATLESIERTFGALTRGAPMRKLDVDLTLDGMHVSGSLAELFDTAHVRVQYSEPQGRHELRHFVRHVVMRCLAEQDPGLGLPRASYLIGRESSLCLELRGSATEALRELLLLYTEALSQPLPLFAAASRTYAEQLAKGNAREQALSAARRAYGDEYQAARDDSRGLDYSDAYAVQLFGSFEQMLAQEGSRFENSALRLYQPLMAARRDV